MRQVPDLYAQPRSSIRFYSGCVGMTEPTILSPVRRKVVHIQLRSQLRQLLSVLGLVREVFLGFEFQGGSIEALPNLIVGNYLGVGR